MVDPEVKYAIMVQRAIRLRWHIYRQYGTELFCDAQGQTGQAGTIVFENTRAQWLKAAQFTSAMRLNLFLNHHWCLPRPESIISVIGTSKDLNLPPALRNAFAKGLSTAAAQAHPWIFTAGCDTGVCVLLHARDPWAKADSARSPFRSRSRGDPRRMKLVGEAMARNAIESPLIGILPWGVVNHRNVLSTDVQRASLYKSSPPSPGGVPLNPYHTHFIFVDDGNEGCEAWGCEDKMRTSLETHIHRMKKVAQVMLVRHHSGEPYQYSERESEEGRESEKGESSPSPCGPPWRSWCTADPTSSLELCSPREMAHLL
jgi:hypothetical protein